MKLILRLILILFLILTFGFLLFKFFINKNSNQNASQQLDISVCDPANANFSSDISNPYFPYPAGKVSVLESSSEKVQITSLDETESVVGVTTRVIEEREWTDGQLAEISRNFFAQTPDGTVCYFGEDVDIYENDQIVAHEGAWRAGERDNKPGIMMPASPTVGQSYQQEIAPGVAEDSAKHEAFEESFTVPAGTFSDVLLVKETPASTKRYAKDIGLIFDDGMVLSKD